MADNIIWFKGELIPQSQASVPVLSSTAQFGLNVFEGIRCYWNEKERQLYAFRLKEHFDRLQTSCKLIRIECPYDSNQLEDALIKSIQANEFKSDCAVRMTLFVESEGSWSTEGGSVGMFVAPILRTRVQLPVKVGKKACVSSWERINDNCLPPRVKAGSNYINGRYAHMAAIRGGYDLPVFLVVRNSFRKLKRGLAGRDLNAGFAFEMAAFCFFINIFFVNILGAPLFFVMLGFVVSQKYDLDGQRLVRENVPCS